MTRSCSSRRLAVVVLACTLGCQASVPGDTGADRTLKRDIRRNLGFCENRHGGDLNPEVLATEALGVDGSTVRERWTVSRDGREIEYELTLSQLRDGGVDIQFHCPPA